MCWWQLRNIEDRILIEKTEVISIKTIIGYEAVKSFTHEDCEQVDIGEAARKVLLRFNALLRNEKLFTQ